MSKTLKLVDLNLSSANISINPDQVVSVEQLGLKYSDRELPPTGLSTVVTLSTGKQIKLNRPLVDVEQLLADRVTGEA